MIINLCCLIEAIVVLSTVSISIPYRMIREKNILLDYNVRDVKDSAVPREQDTSASVSQKTVWSKNILEYTLILMEFR